MRIIDLDSVKYGICYHMTTKVMEQPIKLKIDTVLELMILVLNDVHVGLCIYLPKDLNCKMFSAMHFTYYINRSIATKADSPYLGYDQ